MAGRGMGAGRKGLRERRGGKAASQGEPGPGDGREAVAKETRLVLYQAKGAQHPLAGVCLRV